MDALSGAIVAITDVNSVVFVIVGIMGYLWIRLEQRFGIAALVTEVHDVLVTLGIFALTQREFDLTVLASVLAVVGYSINDKVVVFDRVRELFRSSRHASPEEVLNRSINSTLSRTIITSPFAGITMAALFFYGGPAVHGFAITLLVGIVVGTLSSIFVAGPILFWLGVSKQDLMPETKDDSMLEGRPREKLYSPLSGRIGTCIGAGKKMNSLSTTNDLLNSLAMYFSSKRTALRSAMRLRSPLSVDQAEDLRVHYSNYFINLLSGIDIVRDSGLVERGSFTRELEEELVTPHALDGKQNYWYVRELRNSIVHRGMNIFVAASFPNNFPLLIAPHMVTSPDGTKIYPRFAERLIEIIGLCETVVGPLIERGLRNAGLFSMQVDPEIWRAETVAAIESADFVPAWVKKVAPEAMLSVDPCALHQSMVDKLMSVLKPCPLMLQEPDTPMPPL